MVVNELIEYSYELDVNFSRSALHSIWKLGIIFSKQVESVISALSSILVTVSENQFANHILNELVVGVFYIYRKYQKKVLLNSSVILFCQNFERFNEEKSMTLFLELVSDFMDIVPN